jgi:hypothetical protein
MKMRFKDLPEVQTVVEAGFPRGSDERSYG